MESLDVCVFVVLDCFFTQTPLVESKSGSEFAPVIDEFRARVKAGEGAVLFAVCRGKVCVPCTPFVLWMVNAQWQSSES